MSCYTCPLCLCSSFLEMLQQSLTAALVLNQAFPSDVQLDNYGNYGLGMENSWEISETIG